MPMKSIQFPFPTSSARASLPATDYDLSAILPQAGYVGNHMGMNWFESGSLI